MYQTNLSLFRNLCSRWYIYHIYFFNVGTPNRVHLFGHLLRPVFQIWKNYLPCWDSNQLPPWYQADALPIELSRLGLVSDLQNGKFIKNCFFSKWYEKTVLADLWYFVSPMDIILRFIKREPGLQPVSRPLEQSLLGFTTTGKRVQKSAKNVWVKNKTKKCVKSAKFVFIGGKVEKTESWGSERMNFLILCYLWECSASSVNE